MRSRYLKINKWKDSGEISGFFMSSFLRMESVSDLSLEWRNDKKQQNSGKAKNPTIPQWQSGKKLSVYGRRMAKNWPNQEPENRTRSHTSKEPKNFNSSLQLCLQKIILIRSQYDKKLKFWGVMGFARFVPRVPLGFAWVPLVFLDRFLRSFSAGALGPWVSWLLGDFGSFGSFGMGDKKPR